MPAVVGERIRQVRELRRLTQGSLADSVGFNQSAISQVESGRAQPSSVLLQAVATATGFPVEFFSRPALREFPMGSLLYRARASTTVRELTEARRWAELVYECFAVLGERFERLSNAVPRLTDTSARQAAQLARSALKLSPDRPVLNVTHTLEQSGAVVLAIPMKLGKRDAFSTWLDKSTPVIIVTTGIPGDRLRFSLAHEIGHLVLHHAQQGRLKELEREADEFASEFLMPKSGIEHELMSPISLNNLGQLKQRWGVSIQALIMRARDVKVISTRRAQYLFRALSQQGGRKREPEEFDIPMEKPRMLRRMMEQAYGEPIDPRRLAADFSLPREVASALIGVHATRQEVTAVVPEPDPSKIVSIRSRA